MDNIRKRKSTQAYEVLPFQIEAIDEIVTRQYNGLFDKLYTFQIIADETAKAQGIYKMLNANLLSGSPAFIFGVVGTDRLSLIDYGYTLEKIVLELTSRQIATCWLGGTKRFEKKQNIRPDETIPAVISLGYESGYTKWYQKVKNMTKSDKKGLDYLVYQDFIGNPLKSFYRNKYGLVLEALEKMPFNKQSWRLVMTKNAFRFYVETFTTTENQSQLRYIDTGIALSHFESAMRLMGQEGVWQTELLPSFERYEYVISYTLE